MARPNLIDLLAYLDLKVEESKQRSLQDEDIEEYVQQVLCELAGKFDNRYTVKEIKDELLREFRRGDGYPEYNFPQLILLGSSQMRALDPKTTKCVENQLKFLRPKQVSQRSRQPREFFASLRWEPKVNPRISSTPIRQGASTNTDRRSRISTVRRDTKQRKTYVAKARGFLPWMKGNY